MADLTNSIFRTCLVVCIVYLLTCEGQTPGGITSGGITSEAPTLPPNLKPVFKLNQTQFDVFQPNTTLDRLVQVTAIDPEGDAIRYSLISISYYRPSSDPFTQTNASFWSLDTGLPNDCSISTSYPTPRSIFCIDHVTGEIFVTSQNFIQGTYLNENDYVQLTIRAVDKGKLPAITDFVTRLDIKPKCGNSFGFLQTLQQKCQTTDYSSSHFGQVPQNQVSVGTFRIVPIIEINFQLLFEVPPLGVYKFTLNTTLGIVTQEYMLIRDNNFVNVTMDQPAKVGSDATVEIFLQDPSGNPVALSSRSYKFYSVSSRSSCLENTCVESLKNWENDVYNLKYWTDRCVHEDVNLLRYQYNYCKDNKAPVFPPSPTFNLVVPASSETEIGKLIAIDPENRPLKYSIYSVDGTDFKTGLTPLETVVQGSDDCVESQQYGQPRSFFCIDFNTGMIKTTNNFGGDVRQVFTIRIYAVDGSVSPTRRAEGLIIVKVIDKCHPASEIYSNITITMAVTCLPRMTTARSFMTTVTPYIDFTTSGISKLVEFESNTTLFDSEIPAGDEVTELLIKIQRLKDLANFAEFTIPYKRKQGVVKQAFSLYVVTSPADSIRLTIRPKSLSSISAEIDLPVGSVTLRGFFYSRTCGRSQCVSMYNLWKKAAAELSAECNTDPFLLDLKYNDCSRKPTIITNPPKFITGSLISGKLQPFLQCSYFSFANIQRIEWLKDGEAIPSQDCGLGEEGELPLRRKKREAAVVLPRTSTAMCGLKLENADQQGRYSCRIVAQDVPSVISEEGVLQMSDVSTTRLEQKFTTIAFHPEMNNKNSTQFQQLNKTLYSWFEDTIANTSLKNDKYELVIKHASKGSVVANFTAYFPRVSEEDRIRIATAMSSLGNNTINNNDQTGLQEVLNLDVCLASTTGREDIRGIYEWKVTLSGESLISLPCKYGGGNITRICQPGFYAPLQWSMPLDKDCKFKSRLTNDLFILSEAIVTADNVTEVSKDLLNLTNSASTATSSTEYDIEFVSNTLQNIANVNDTSEEVISIVLEVVNSLLTFDRTIIAKAQRTFGSSTSVIQTLETVSGSITIPSGNTSLSINLPNIALSVLDFGETSAYRIDGLTLTSPRSNVTNDNMTINLLAGNHTLLSIESQATIYLPPSLISRVFGSNGTITIRVTTFIFINNNLFISDTNLDSAGNLTSQTINATVDSRVMSASLPGQKMNNLVDPMESYFRSSSVNVSTNPARCVFWDFNSPGGLGAWSTEGCRLRERQNGIYVCQCDHLTNFAVLLDINDPGKAGSSPLVLEIITYIGCGISMASLLLTLLTFAIFPNLRKSLPPRILMCLCISILALLIVFVVGIDRTSPRVGCQIVGMLLHYLVLAIFCWMAVEGFNLYRSFVKVLGSYTSKFLLKASIFAWGVPAVIVAVTAGIRFDDYGSASNCMLQGNTFYFAFLTPIAVILFMNFIILFLVLVGIRKGTKLSKDKKTDAKATLRIAFACSIILGLTWASAFFAIDDLRLTFQIIFCVLNSFQGFFIFLFYCVRNPEVRKEWRRVFGLKPVDSRGSTTGSTGKKNKTASTLDSKSKKSTNGGSQSSLLNQHGHSTNGYSDLPLTDVNGHNNGSTRPNNGSHEPNRTSYGHNYENERF